MAVMMAGEVTGVAWALPPRGTELGQWREQPHTGVRPHLSAQLRELWMPEPLEAGLWGENRGAPWRGPCDKGLPQVRVLAEEHDRGPECGVEGCPGAGPPPRKHPTLGWSRTRHSDHPRRPRGWKGLPRGPSFSGCAQASLGTEGPHISGPGTSGLGTWHHSCPPPFHLGEQSLRIWSNHEVHPNPQTVPKVVPEKAAATTRRGWLAWGSGILGLGKAESLAMPLTLRGASGKGPLLGKPQSAPAQKG